MKIAFITVFYHTPESESERIRKEIDALGFADYAFYPADNTATNRGYAEGVNRGMRQAYQDGADIFVIINPDISLAGLNAREMLEGAEKFDIWGLAMRQENNTYYGGGIEKWRMSGGLLTEKPSRRFTPVDYVTGSLMFVKRTAIEEIGYLDEGYFMYYEDVDYCERARRRGLRVGIDSALSYVHFETSRQYEGKKYQLAKNRLLFLLKFGSWRQKLRELVRTPKTIIEDRVLWITLLRSSFIMSFASLNASALIGKGLNFLLFLVLVRYISIKDYGIYTLVWAHVTLLSPLVDFGTTSYGMVYLPQEKRSRLQSLFSLRTVLSLLVFALTVILAYIFRYSPQITFYIVLTSFTIFYNMVTGTYLIVSSLENTLVRNSIISILTNTAMIGTMIFAVVHTGSLTVLFYLICFFYSAYALLYFYLLIRSAGRMRFVFEPGEWIAIMKKSYIFVLISLFAGIYFKVDVLILNFLKGTAAVGSYSSGYKFFEATILLASSYNTLAAPILSRTAHSRRPKLFAVIAKHALFLTAVGLGTVLAVQFFGSAFLPHILKGNYARAMDVVAIVMWALPFILYNSIFFNVLYAANLAHVVIFVFLGISIFNAVCNIIFIPHFSFIASSYITVISEIMDFTVLLVIIFVIYRKKIFYG